MAHRDATDVADEAPTVYNRGVSVEEDPDAEDWWSDELNHRLNLRIPEWMWDDLEQHAEYQQQEVAAMTRELLEFALMQVNFESWQGINARGRHTYGDVKCPACAEEHSLRLRWHRERGGDVRIRCMCDALLTVEQARAAKALDRPLAEIWFNYALNRRQMDPYEVATQFDTFREDPRSFVESVDWDDELTDAGESIEKMTGNAQTEAEQMHAHLEEWEEGQ